MEWRLCSFAYRLFLLVFLGLQNTASEDSDGYTSSQVSTLVRALAVVEEVLVERFLHLVEVSSRASYCLVLPAIRSHPSKYVR